MVKARGSFLRIPTDAHGLGDDPNHGTGRPEYNWRDLNAQRIVPKTIVSTIPPQLPTVHL